MSHQDYLAALDRLRRVKTDEPLSEIYGKPLVCPEDIRTDKATIYDAEHDPTPATAEWLRGLPSTLRWRNTINISVRLDGLRISIFNTNYERSNYSI